MEATPGCCTIPWFSSIWFSEIRQIVISALRNAGLRAHRFRMTSELRSSADMLETSPAGAMVSAKSMTSPIFLPSAMRSEEHTSELQSQSNLVCRLLLEKKKKKKKNIILYQKNNKKKEE